MSIYCIYQSAHQGQIKVLPVIAIVWYILWGSLRAIFKKASIGPQWVPLPLGFCLFIWVFLSPRWPELKGQLSAGFWGSTAQVTLDLSYGLIRPVLPVFFQIKLSQYIMHAMSKIKQCHSQSYETCKWFPKMAVCTISFQNGNLSSWKIYILIACGSMKFSKPASQGMVIWSPTRVLSSTTWLVTISF